MQQIGQQEGQAACMSELQGLLERECQAQVAPRLFRGLHSCMEQHGSSLQVCYQWIVSAG